jgi:hypothetical protein
MATDMKLLDLASWWVKENLSPAEVQERIRLYKQNVRRRRE